MNIIKKYLMRKLTVNDLVEYFYSMGMGIDIKLNKKELPRYYAKNSRLYKRTFKESNK